MAVRRSFGDDANESDQFPMGGLEDNINQPLTGLGTGNFDEFGNELPDFSNDPNFPKPFIDYTPNEIAGNKDMPAQVFGNQGPRTPTAPIPMEEIMSLLPQGVEAGPSAEASGMGAGSVPGLPSEPSPQVMRHQPPAMSATEDSMPKRNTFESPSALFAGGGQQGLSRIGGFSLPGQNQGGPQATQAMLKLLEQLKGVGL